MEENKLVLPAIAVRGIVPLPNNEFRIEVGRENSVLALDAAEKMYGGNVLLLIQKDANKVDVETSDIEKIGVLAKITLKLKLPNKNYKVKFKIADRIEVLEYTSTEPYFVCAYDKLHSISSGDDLEAALVKKVSAAISNAGINVLANPEEVSKLIAKEINPAVLSDVIAYNLKTSGKMSNKYRYLECLDVSTRLQYILDDIEHEKAIVEIENKINKDVKKSIDESQKEYYLREKMKAIQNELGDKARQEEDVENLRKALEEAKLPANVYEKAKNELQKNASTSNQMAESGVIRTYLVWIIKLPWYKQSDDVNDLKKVSESLDKNHYGLDKVKDRIIEYLAVKMMTGKNPNTILCFAGPPGVVKHH